MPEAPPVADPLFDHLTRDLVCLLPAVEDVNLDVGRHEIVAVVGESGSGKTVTCLSIIQLVAARKAFKSEGSIRFEGRELLGISERELRQIRGRDIGIVFQEPMTSLDPVLTIGKQLDETLKAHTSLSAAQRHARCVELLQPGGHPGTGKNA